jgi:hypothetical protein
MGDTVRGELLEAERAGGLRKQRRRRREPGWARLQADEVQEALGGWRQKLGKEGVVRAPEGLTGNGPWEWGRGCGRPCTHSYPSGVYSVMVTISPQSDNIILPLSLSASGLHVSGWWHPVSSTYLPSTFRTWDPQKTPRCLNHKLNPNLVVLLLPTAPTDLIMDPAQ